MGAAGTGLGAGACTCLSTVSGVDGAVGSDAVADATRLGARAAVLDAFFCRAGGGAAFGALGGFLVADVPAGAGRLEGLASFDSIAAGVGTTGVAAISLVTGCRE